MEEIKPHIEIRSPEVQEILGRTPHWMLRSGITAIFLFIVLVLTASWFIKYPDVIVAPVEITSNNPPIQLQARYSGKLDLISCFNQQLVDSGQVLAVIKNPALSTEMYQLIRFLKWTDSLAKINDSLFNSLDSIKCSLPKFSQLGETQNYFEAFLKALDEFITFENLHALERKIESLEKQKNKQSEYIANLQKQNSITLKQGKLSQKQFYRDSMLFKGGALSESEYEKSKVSFLESGYRAETGKMAIINAEIQFRQIEQQIIDLQTEIYKTQNALELQFSSAIANLRNSLETWEHQYVFVSTKKGRVVFNKLWSANQNIRSGETLLTLVPLEESEIIAKARISISGSGKIKPNQQVNIKLFNYPFQEFGIIEGRLLNLSEAPTDSLFMADINLPNGLRTNYGKEIVYSQGLNGKAEIITDDLSLFIRFFNPIRSLLKEKVK